MNKRRFGRTDLQVTELGYGTMELRKVDAHTVDARDYPGSSVQDRTFTRDQPGGDQRGWWFVACYAIEP